MSIPTKENIRQHSGYIEVRVEHQKGSTWVRVDETHPQYKEIIDAMTKSSDFHKVILARKKELLLHKLDDISKAIQASGLRNEKPLPQIYRDYLAVRALMELSKESTPEQVAEALSKLETHALSIREFIKQWNPEGYARYYS